MIIDETRQQSLKKYVYSIYILQALSFLTLVTAVIAVVISYIKDEDARGSWLETHFTWQKATFWYGLLWMLLGYLSTWILVGYLVMILASIWIFYRIARGWIYLVDEKAMYPRKS